MTEFSVDPVLAARIRRAQMVARSVIRKSQIADFTYPWLGVQIDVAAAVGENWNSLSVVAISKQPGWPGGPGVKWSLTSFDVAPAFISGSDWEVAKRVRADLAAHRRRKDRESEEALGKQLKAAEEKAAAANRDLDRVRARVESLAERTAATSARAARRGKSKAPTSVSV